MKLKNVMNIRAPMRPNGRDGMTRGQLKIEEPWMGAVVEFPFFLL